MFTNLPEIKKEIKFENLGLREYSEVYQYQKQLVELRKQDKIGDTVLWVEHPAVYTFGRKIKDIPNIGNTVSIERGGEATYHNPGQLVCYPILKLAKSERDIPKFMRNLEEVFIQLLFSYDIFTERKEGATGVWVKNKNKKIASLGVAFSYWVSYHGVALNVKNDLLGFHKINPCGFNAEVMTSMLAEGQQVTVEEIIPKAEVFFRKVF
jgi:lipoyl(octanoyl) transferase